MVEILVVVMIIGILGSLSGLGMVGLVNRGKLKQATTNLQGFFMEIQREAIKKGKTCTISLPEDGTINPVLTSDCAIMGSRTLSGVRIRHNYSGDRLTYNFQGVSNKLGTVILYSDAIMDQTCLVNSNRVGQGRRGRYAEDKRTGTSAQFCDTLAI